MILILCSLEFWDSLRCIRGFGGKEKERRLGKNQPPQHSLSQNSSTVIYLMIGVVWNISSIKKGPPDETN